MLRLMWRCVRFRSCACVVSRLRACGGGVRARARMLFVFFFCFFLFLFLLCPGRSVWSCVFSLLSFPFLLLLSLALSSPVFSSFSPCLSLWPQHHTVTEESTPPDWAANTGWNSSLDLFCYLLGVLGIGRVTRVFISLPP